MPCVSHIISFNRTFDSHYIIEGGLMKWNTYQRGGGGGGGLEYVINTNKQPWYWPR